MLGTSKEGPGCHPGMSRNAAAGLMEAGSVVVATTSVTISSEFRPYTVELSLPSRSFSIERRAMEGQHNWELHGLNQRAFIGTSMVA